MKKKLFQLFCLASVVYALLLGGCSDFDEMKSQRMFIQAEALMQQGKEAQAEQVLADLVARYPRTQPGVTASLRLSQIQKKREATERQAFAKVLDSYQQVLNGYYALYSEYPRSIATLDKSDYLFDSAYLEQITPDNYQAYLWLSGDGKGYRVWCVARDKERGYAIESQSRKLAPFDRDDIMKKLKVRFQASSWDGRLVKLQARN